MIAKFKEAMDDSLKGSIWTAKAGKMLASRYLNGTCGDISRENVLVIRWHDVNHAGHFLLLQNMN